MADKTDYKVRVTFTREFDITGVESREEAKEMGALGLSNVIHGLFHQEEDLTVDDVEVEFLRE